MALDATMRDSLIDRLAGQDFSGLTETPPAAPTQTQAPAAPVASEPSISAGDLTPKAAAKPNGDGTPAAVTPPAPGVKQEMTPEAPTAADTKQVEDLPALPDGVSESEFKIPYNRLKKVIGERNAAKQEAQQLKSRYDRLEAEVQALKAQAQAGVVGQPPKQAQPPSRESDWLDEYVDTGEEAAEPTSDAPADPHYQQLEQRLHRIEMERIGNALDREVDAALAAYPETSRAALYQVVAKNPGVNLVEYAERARDRMTEYEERVIAKYLEQQPKRAAEQAPAPPPQAEPAAPAAEAKPTVFPRPRVSGSGQTTTAKPQIRTIKEASAAVLAALGG